MRDLVIAVKNVKTVLRVISVPIYPLSAQVQRINVQTVPIVIQSTIQNMILTTVQLTVHFVKY